MEKILYNRDLSGRVRLVVDERCESEQALRAALEAIAVKMKEALGPHAYDPAQAILYEADFAKLFDEKSTFPLPDFGWVRVADRMAVEGNWSNIQPATTPVPRIVFFSIKGGVGRSTALAATAWALAERGKRVLVLDLDLESPGLSSSLLPEDRRPAYGITDWLVEDLVDNGDAIFDSLVATSELSRNGEILVVPAHGANPGEYVPKLGRVWMPKVNGAGQRESWAERLRRLLEALEQRWAPDLVLIDSRAGIDEVASACLTELSAGTILLFSLDGNQTWAGYRILFQHWRKTDVVRDIRERLQIVGAMIPEIGSQDYFDGLLEQAWNLFSDELYDEVPAGTVPGEGEIWSFDAADEGAPHYPWAVRWHRGFSALRSMHGRLREVSLEEVTTTFGPLIEGLYPLLAVE